VRVVPVAADVVESEIEIAAGGEREKSWSTGTCSQIAPAAAIAGS
jgi:hypothetical protein